MTVEHPNPNPLRDPRDRRLPRVPGPCALVVFGVTGDLARKKLIPAIYDLGNRGLLPPGFVLLGFARRDWGDGDFEQLARTSAQEHSRTEFREDVWQRLADSLRFVPGSFDDDNAFDELNKTLIELEDSHGIAGNTAFYLSIPPAAFPVVLKQLQRTGMAEDSVRGGWRRVVVEKPFGHDLASSRELNQLVDSVFTPQDVFRIDHYLGKETVQNLLALRFANTLFEPVWNSNYVDSIQITMAEDVGIGGAPSSTTRRGRRATCCRTTSFSSLLLPPWRSRCPSTPKRSGSRSARSSARSPCRKILPPSPCGASTTGAGWPANGSWGTTTRRTSRETRQPRPTLPFVSVSRPAAGRGFPSISAPASASRGASPRSPSSSSAAPHLPFAKTDTTELGNNQLVVRVQPDEGITLRFGSKVPGSMMEVREVSMDFLYGAAFTESSPEAYERLLLDVLIGDRTLFPDHNEVEASWRVIDPMEEFWAGTQPHKYRAGEWGPREADEMLAREARSWRRP